MQTRRVSDISMISTIVVAILGISAVPALAATTTCVDDGTVEVCAEWSQAMPPKEGTPAVKDFEVTFHTPPAGADVALKTGDPEWRLWTTLVSGGAVTHFGDITLDPTANGDNFVVQIFGDVGPGAVNVGSINLDGTINNPSWVGYSSMKSAAFFSWISGNVNGVITLIETSAGAGGEMGIVHILGEVAGLITIPTLSGSLQIGNYIVGGDVKGGFVIDLLEGGLLILGTLPSPKIGEIGDIVSGSFNIDTVAFGATLDLLNGMPLAAGSQSNVRTLAGTLDMHTKDMRSGLFLGDVLSTGEVVNGGTIAAIFYPSFNGDFAGKATFTSVEAGGQIYAFDSNIPKDTNISGKITINGDYAGLFKVDGDFTSTALLTITGDLKASSGDDGLIWIVEAAAGDIIIKGDLIGHVHHPKSFPTNGSLTVEGNVTSSGVFKTGDNATGETHDGDLILKGNVVGDILIHGNMSGDVTIDIDLSGSVAVDGALANAGLGGGQIMIAGESSGAIQVGEKTGSLTLIQVAGGLATGATIEINTTQGAFDAQGDIHIGGTTPTALPFDGCIRIYDESGTGNEGDLEGNLDIVMCHADGDQLVVCIDGSDNGNVTLDQTGCDPANATWDCYSPGCP